MRERGVVPTLAIVRVGEREDDLSYERGALKRCDKVGIEARRVLLPAEVSQDELLATIKDINADSADGFMVTVKIILNSYSGAA